MLELAQISMTMQLQSKVEGTYRRGFKRPPIQSGMETVVLPEVVFQEVGNGLTLACLFQK